MQPQWLCESGSEATLASLPTVPVKCVLQDKTSDSLDGGSVVLAIYSEFKSRLGNFSREGEEGETANRLCPKRSRGSTESRMLLAACAS